MLKYFVIGMIAQTIVLIERAVRLPKVRNVYKEGGWIFFTGLIIGSLLSVLIWPVQIIIESINIIHGQ